MASTKVDDMCDDSCYEESELDESESESDSESRSESESDSESDSELESNLNDPGLGFGFDQGEGSKQSIVEEVQNGVEEEDVPLEKPYKGQRFNSLDEAKRFYVEYGRKEGFGVKVRDSKRDKTRENQINRLILCCDREGRHKKRFKVQEDPSKPIIRRNTSTQKCGCLAMFRVFLEKSGQWVINAFHDEHNHKSVTPVKQVCMKGNRHFPRIVKDLVQSFRDINLPVGKVVQLFDGKRIGFDERDCYNHLGSTRTCKTPLEGDATAMANFFLKRQADDPQFFYAIQTDKESRAVNFLWVDGRSRSQYQYFDDVLYFDTTYKKNVYKMPFAPFTGVNHHLQSIQFGCALLLDETEETFVWAFETWLKAMGGKSPKAMITDQDRAMGSAVARVFPDTRHRYCLWHILKKFPEKLKLYKKKSKFKRKMQWCIRGFHRISDFEKRWGELMVKYELTENSWLKKLYSIREKWVPVYHLDTFYGGMNTTGRSEGMNSFYKRFFTRHTTLREFAYKNEVCLERIVEREKKEDYATEHKERLLDEEASLLESAAELYTKQVYALFKKQWNAQKHYTLLTSSHTDDIHTFIYKSRNVKDSREWEVRFDIKTHEGKCDCKMFENTKLLCPHILKVLFARDIYKIPEHFICRRWLKGANEYRTKFDGGVVSGHQSSRILRCTHLAKLANALAYEASEEDESYTYMTQKFHELSIQYKKHKESLKAKTMSSVNSNNVDEADVVDASQAPPIDPSQEPLIGASQDPPIDPSREPPIGASQEPPSGASQEPPFDPSMLLNPVISKTKGREKDDHKSDGDRLKGGFEKKQRKDPKVRECTLCKASGLPATGHNIRTCSLNPNRKK